MLRRRTFLAAAAAGSTIPLVAGCADAAVVGKVLARGLRVPWGVAFLPSGDAVICERMTGVVYLVSKNGGRTAVGTVTETVPNNEAGLLGVALSPDFATDNKIFFYVSTASDNRVLQAKFVNNQIGARTPLLTGIPSGSIHNGGRLAFGPDGMLYASTGETGHDAGLPRSQSWAQNKDNLGGKILRMHMDGSAPADNPFNADGPRAQFVWSLGHRNVQGLAWDGSGRMWATELGQHTRDELNHIVKGGNYGWPVVEGGDGSGPFRDPFVVWRPTSTCSPSGLAITQGRAWVGALAGEALFSVKLRRPQRRRKVRHFHNRFGRIRTVQLAPDGSLWITTSNNDGLHSTHPGDDKVIRILV